MTNLEKLIKADACSKGIGYYKKHQERLDKLILKDHIVVNILLDFEYLEWVVREKLISPKSLKWEVSDGDWEKWYYDKNGNEIKYDDSTGYWAEYDTVGNTIDEGNYND